MVELLISRYELEFACVRTRATQRRILNSSYSIPDFSKPLTPGEVPPSVAERVSNSTGAPAPARAYARDLYKGRNLS